MRDASLRSRTLQASQLWSRQQISLSLNGACPAPRALILPLGKLRKMQSPTLRGWWEERDLDLKEQLGLFPEPGEASRQRQWRKSDRTQLLGALRSEELLPPDGEPDIPTLAR